jgi:hypothetical protein
MAMVIRDNYRQLIKVKPAGTPAEDQTKTCGTPDPETS